MNKEIDEKVKLESRKIVFSTDEDDPKERVTLLSAKRKFWIEWECTLDKFPTDDQLDILNEKLRKYIKRYLERLPSNKYQNISGYEDEYKKSVEESSKGAGIFDEIGTEITDAFDGLIDAKDLRFDMDKGGDYKNKVLIEFSRWDGDEWVIINKKDYANAVVKNLGIAVPEEMDILKYTVYTKKWMEIFEHAWKRVSDSHLVFSYRGWFVTKNNIRLTTESRGSMNPPPPPPPPK